MNCQCCSNAKARLSAVESKLIPGNKLMLCTDCKREGHEPRHFIIIAAHSGKQIRDYVKHTRYCGRLLEAHEVIN